MERQNIWTRKARAADHDEYTTFFANSKSNLDGVIEPLLKQGFKPVDYERNL